jgi:molybdenum cofactor sulfurtransferase
MKGDVFVEIMVRVFALSFVFNWLSVIHVEEFGGIGGKKPLGVVRILFGASSTVDDVLSFIGVLKSSFSSQTKHSQSLHLYHHHCINHLPNQQYTFNHSRVVSNISSFSGYTCMLILHVDPIKSCASESLLTSKLAPTGLIYDREFMVVNPATGYMMSQKQFPRMARIKPVIDEESGVMRVRAEGMKDLVVGLEAAVIRMDVCWEEMDLKVCGDVVRSHQPSDEAAEWFSTFLSIRCIVFLQHRHHVHHIRTHRYLVIRISTKRSPARYYSQTPFLLISQSSAHAVNSWMEKDNSDQALIHPSYFRANFVM